MIFLEKSIKTRRGPDLDKYIRKQKRYKTYIQAYRFYSLSYNQLVRLAKEADACWQVRKTVLVDLDKLDSYMENLREGD